MIDILPGSYCTRVFKGDGAPCTGSESDTMPRPQHDATPTYFHSFPNKLTRIKSLFDDGRFTTKVHWIRPSNHIHTINFYNLI